MRLHVELFEDARGNRSVHASVTLHGPAVWPAGMRIEHVPDLAAGVLRKILTFPRGPMRRVADLDLLAPDDARYEGLRFSLDALGPRLLSHSQAWIFEEGTAARLWLYANDPVNAQDVLAALMHAANTRLLQRDRRTTLRVQELDVSNFRGLERLALDLPNSQTTVLVGTNGSGKTTILDALVFLLASLEAGLQKRVAELPTLSDDDVTNGRETTFIGSTALIESASLSWRLSHTRRGERTSPLTVGPAFHQELHRIRGQLAGDETCLPIAVHYGVNRTVLEIPLQVGSLDANDGALTQGSSNFRHFFEWFRAREDLENEIRISESAFRDPQLEAVRRATTAILPEGFSDLRVQRSPLRMVVTKGDWTLYVDQLSDGEKCLLAMAGDLARRLALANPLADDPLKGGGVILIDEIELHLHPGWQRTIVPALERTCPNCQFIVSTHSAAVLGHVDHESVLILEQGPTGVFVTHPSFSRGMDMNRIVEDLLDVPSRPKEFVQKLEELHARIDARDFPGARTLRDELASTLGADDPALVKAEILIRRGEARRT